MSAVSWAWGRELEAQKPDSEQGCGCVGGEAAPKLGERYVVRHRGLADTLGSGLG